jgi:two-component system cell cycle sensor histidine kinase/response regulator CckA
MKTSMYTGVRTILLVDHEDYLCSFLNKLLEKKGYKVIVANNVNQAVDVFLANQSRIDLILMDITKEIEYGVMTCNNLKKTDPEVLILLTSIYSQESLGGLSNLPFIRKPMIPSELFKTINEMFSNIRLQTNNPKHASLA